MFIIYVTFFIVMETAIIYVQEKLWVLRSFNKNNYFVSLYRWVEQNGQILRLTDDGCYWKLRKPV